MASYSISLRLQRLTTEEAWVSIPVSQEVMKDAPEPDGSWRIDTQKVREAALRLGADPNLRWTPEGASLVTPHPVQRPPRATAEPPEPTEGGSTSGTEGP
jgi:hypothetical protein